MEPKALRKLGRRIKAARLAAELSQQELATKSRVTERLIRELEAGAVEDFYMTELYQIAKC